MRTIKFRGIGKRTGTWIYGNLIQLGGAYIISPIYDEYEVVPDHSTECALGFHEDEFDVIEPDSLGQFTGLVDKNGKEIYEGDIVKYTRYDWKTEGYQKQNLIDYCRIYYNETKCAYYYETKFKSGGGCSGFLLFNDERCKKNEIEVIGNIYDNPELLND